MEKLTRTPTLFLAASCLALALPGCTDSPSSPPPKQELRTWRR